MINHFPDRYSGTWIFRSMVFLLTFLSGYLAAQDLNRHNWLFGNSTNGIVFNISDNLPTLFNSKGTPFGNAASAVATDRVSGDLLFYTDGVNVYDNTHSTISGWTGPGLNANSAGNQGVAISPRPGFPGQYLIFTNSASYPAAGTVSYTVVNMNLAGNAAPSAPALGAITSQNNPGALSDGITVNPGMLVIESGNDPFQYYLVVQNAANGAYHLYSIGSAVATLVNVLPNPSGLIAANFSIDQQTGLIAVSPQNQGENIQILQFDPVASALSYVRDIPNTATFDAAGQSIYDVEFSPDTTKIYISRHGDNVNNGVLYSYDLSNPLASLEQVNPNPIYRSYGLQYGPDGSLYHLYQEINGGPIEVARITNPNEPVTANIIYQTDPLGNNVNFNGRQFPALAPRAPITFLPNDFEVVNQNTCERSPTKFFPNVDPPADFYRWDFGDPTATDNFSNQVAPIHTYAGPGTYTVTLTAGIGGTVTTSTQVVNVIANQDSVDLGQDTVICPTESLVLDAGPNGQLYRWSTGETGQTITVDSSNATGYFWVVVDYGTCTSYDGINVEEYGESIQTANFWYFGRNAGIDFNEQPPVAVADGQIDSPEGAATISDRTGNLLFSTDGSVVFDADQNPMDNGFALGGDNGSTQSSIVVPFPNDETLFYIFTTIQVFNAGGAYTLKYSVVDIKELGGGTVGSVVAKDKPLFEESTERMTATAPGGFVWLVTHELGNNTFRVYPITDQGIGNPVLTSIGSVHDANNAEEAQGYMKLSTDGRRIAVSLTKGGKNYVEIFDFDPATGILSNYLQIELPVNNPPYQVYGVEFSSNSEKLFVTVNNPTSPGSKLYELKLHVYDKDSIEDKIVELADEPGVNLGAIQTGPDGQIYVAKDGQQFLATILENLDTLTNSTYMSDGFDLVTGTSSLGLPNFVQSYMQQTPQATATVIPACVDQTVTFIGSGTSIIDTFLWTFGDGGSATSDSTSHVYIAPALYTVAFNVSNRCGLDTTIVQQIDISGYPDAATINPVEVLCDGPLTLDADTNNTGGKFFVWNTGATTQAIQVTSPGIFSVRIINAAGCETQDSTQVFDGRPPINLGPDITICQNDVITLDTSLPVGTPPNTFTWYRNGLNMGINSNTHTIDSSTPGVFTYIVNVVDGLTSCIGSDTVVVTINSVPTATYVVTNSTCGITNGQINITSPLTNLTAEWFNPSNVSIGTGASSPLIAAGAYTLIVTSDISGCQQTYPINVIDSSPQFTIAVTPVQQCSGTQLDVTVTSTALPLNLFTGGRYTLTNVGSLTVFETDTLLGNSSSTKSFFIDSIPQGTYDLLVNGFGCTNQQTGIVTTDKLIADVAVSPSLDVCSSTPTISASSTTAGAIYTWTGPNAFLASGQTVDITAGGSGTYFVRVSVAGGIPCDTVASTQVILHISPTPLIDPLTDGCDGTRQVGVTNLGTSSYSYLWSTGSAAPSITISNSAVYDVTVRDQITGCQGTDSRQVDVFQPLTVNVTVDKQACQDGNQVVLTATPVPNQTVTYQWYLNGFQLATTTSTLPTFNQGIYDAIVNTGTCQAMGSLEIARAPVTPSNVEPLYVICPEPPANEVALIEPGDFVTYLAYDLNSGQQIFETAPGTFEITEEGDYEFRLENAFNCWTLDTTFVDVNCVPVIYAPNAFSPYSSMPENQTFKIFPTFVTDFEIFIYNRWGELVYYSNDLDYMVNVGWDGQKDGKVMPMGTYAYVMRYHSITEPQVGVLEKQGGITLVR